MSFSSSQSWKRFRSNKRKSSLVISDNKNVLQNFDNLEIVLRKNAGKSIYDISSTFFALSSKT